MRGHLIVGLLCAWVLLEPSAPAGDTDVAGRIWHWLWNRNTWVASHFYPSETECRAIERAWVAQGMEILSRKSAKLESPRARMTATPAV